MIGMSTTRFWICMTISFLLGTATGAIALLILMVIVQARIDYAG